LQSAGIDVAGKITGNGKPVFSQFQERSCKLSLKIDVRTLPHGLDELMIYLAFPCVLNGSLEAFILIFELEPVGF
jgi:hypothetical protein